MMKKKKTSATRISIEDCINSSNVRFLAENNMLEYLLKVSRSYRIPDAQTYSVVAGLDDTQLKYMFSELSQARDYENYLLQKRPEWLDPDLMMPGLKRTH